MTKFGYDAPLRTRLAMDIAEAAGDALQEYREAERDVAPFLGADYDTSDVTSTSDLYKKALLKMGVDLRGVEPVAYKHLVQMMNPDGSMKQSRQAMAADSALERSFSAKFPHIKKAIY